MKANTSNPHLCKLFQILPTIGYGDKKVFEGCKKDLDLAYDIIGSLGSNGLIFKRSQYLQDGGEMNITEWYDLIKNEKTFHSYMLSNYPLVNGEFIFSKDINEMEKLAKIYFSY